MNCSYMKFKLATASVHSSFDDPVIPSSSFRQRNSGASTLHDFTASVSCATCSAQIPTRAGINTEPVSAQANLPRLPVVIVVVTLEEKDVLNVLVSEVDTVELTVVDNDVDAVDNAVVEAEVDPVEDAVLVAVEV